MNSFTKFVAVSAAIAAVVYIAYSSIFPTAYLRYRLTVNVDVDGVTRTGSGVVEISYQPLPDSFASLPGNHFIGDMRGYAITVDLGARGLLFVTDSPPLLRKPEAAREPGSSFALFPKARGLAKLPFVVYGFEAEGLPSTMMGLARQIRQKSRLVDVAPEELPMILYFRDINDGDSNEEVDPRDLAAAIGSGVRLLSAKFEMTRAPVTAMPRNWPKWLVDQQGEEGFMLRAYSRDLYRPLWCTARIFKGK